MAAQKGKDLLVKVDDGTGNFVTVAGLRTRRLSLNASTVDATDSDCAGNEPVYHEGRLVGLTTSGAYGHAVERSLAFAYVEPGLAAPGTELQVALFDRRRRAVVLEDAAWDAANARLRA